MRKSRPVCSSSRGLVPTLRVGLLLAALSVVLLSAATQAATPTPAASNPLVLVVPVNDVMDQIMARFVDRGLANAQKDHASLVVLQIDTPGGSLSATRDMVSHILNSPVPVAAFVGPSGARAASAGTFITAATAFAAMASSTNIGAASPVGSGGSNLPSTEAQKATQDAAAFIRSIAAERGRNADALAATVTNATAYSAAEALDKNVVNYITPTLDSLLAHLDGMSLVANGVPVTVHTANATIRVVHRNFAERALSFLADPNIAFLFFALGGIAIVVELFHPGLVVPAVLGVLFLLLAFAGLGSLPFSWIGVSLIALAFVLFAIEAFVPGFGIFGISGAISLILGGIFLVGFFGTPEIGGPTLQVSRWLLISIGVIAGLAVLWFGRELRKSRQLAGYVSPYSESALVGKTARVTRRLAPEGEVSVAGEMWRARLAGGGVVEAGTDVVVRKVDGLTLEVGLPETRGEPALRSNQDLE